MSREGADIVNHRVVRAFEAFDAAKILAGSYN